jgi:signal transduction histidine kinase
MVDLGPYGFQDVTLAAAIEGSVPVWARRYDLEIELDLDAELLPAPVAGELFRISQEAVINAGRHADATTVRVSLRRDDRGVELRVADDGRGFESRGSKPGHLGLASMRERAELLAGELEIETSETGTIVTARVPLTDA